MSWSLFEDGASIYSIKKEPEGDDAIREMFVDEKTARKILLCREAFSVLSMLVDFNDRVESIYDLQGKARYLLDMIIPVPKPPKKSIEGIGGVSCGANAEATVVRAKDKDATRC